MHARRGPLTRLPEELELWKDRIREHARAYGLDFFEVIFEVLDYDELNMVAAYGGFPTRYPHWRFGMAYEELSKSYSYGLQKIYELVINNDPCYAYLMRQNATVDQKLVMAHVYGHSDFFKQNAWFAHTNRKMLDEMANHATRVRRYQEQYGVDEVESFVDACLSLDNLIDVHSPFIKRRRDPPPSELAEEPEGADRRRAPTRIRAKEYLDRYVNPPEFLDRQRKALADELERQRSFPEEPERDVLWFLLEHAPLERWQRDVLDIIREEAYYFAPQGMTKIMNEGWACVAADTPVFTASGLLPMAEVVGCERERERERKRERGPVEVSDGTVLRRVYDRHIVRDQEVVRVVTRRGLELTGSASHRVLLSDGATWRRLDELARGDRVAVAGGAGAWPSDEVVIDWRPARRVTLEAVAATAGGALWTVLRHRAGRRTRRAGAVAGALASYDAPGSQGSCLLPTRRSAVRIPATVTPELASFLGYLVGDGHVSRVKRVIGLTTGDEEQAAAFGDLARRLFGVRPRMRRDAQSRWRVTIHAEALSDLLTRGLGLTEGPSAPRKHVPEAVLRSPEPVVRAFLRAYFDCAGYAGKQGAILSTTSDALASQTQLLLLNYGVLSRRRRQGDGCWHVHVAGVSAVRFAEQIGFGLARKQEALAAYVADHRWLEKETWEDEVVALERGRADVFDISVEDTHRYAAAGFINHNSFWHSKIMTERALEDCEVIDYAEQHAGTMGTRPGVLNPYKIGLELYRDIEERWDKGRFGKEWEECDDLARRRTWDLRTGLGRKKIFEVRKIYNDLLFIDTFLTPQFCAEHKLFTFEHNPQSGQYEIAEREFRKVKEKLLYNLTNFGQPVIRVEWANFENRGELYLKHQHDGVDLRQDYARETLTNLHRLWTRPVHLETSVDRRRKVLSYGGKKHTERFLT